MAYVSSSGIRLFYRWDGPEHAPVLVLSSSLGTSHAMWDAQIEALGRRFRVLRYDMRGHGASDVPAGPYTIDQLGKDLIALLDGLSVQRAAFCGLSLGGMIGIWLGANAPDRLERLILCNTAARLGTAADWNQRIDVVRGRGMSALADAILERWFTLPFRQSNPAAVNPVRDMLLSTPPEGYAACCAAIREMDQRDRLGDIRAPTLVIGGTQDPATPMEHARFIAAKVPSARLVELPAAHLSNIEAARELNTAVLDFLTPLQRAGEAP